MTVALDAPADDLLALDEILGLLESQYSDCAQLVKLRFFVGLSQADAAATLGIPVGQPIDYGRLLGHGCSSGSVRPAKTRIPEIIGVICHFLGAKDVRRRSTDASEAIAGRFLL